MEDNVGWTYSLACSPEEEWKTLCSLLVLWMTRTNQEDVSAFQFHLLGMNHMHKDLPEAHFGLEKSASAPFSFAW